MPPKRKGTKTSKDNSSSSSSSAHNSGFSSSSIDSKGFGISPSAGESSQKYVWYQLVDSIGGNEICDPSTVTLSSAPFVDIFKKEVFKEDNDDLLTGISAKRLLVYKNRQSFDNKEPPLEVDCSLNSLGWNRLNAVLVSVPKPLHSANSNRGVSDAADFSSRKTSRIVISVAGNKSAMSFPSIETSGQFRSEGLSSQFYTARKPTVQKIINHLWSVDSIPVMFFRAPPFSGKTALCTLLFQEFEKNPEISVVHLSCAEMDSTGSFERLFQQKVQISLEEYMNVRSEKRVLIIDEAQSSYVDTAFWGKLKVFLQNESNLRIIMFAAYGSSEPAINRPGTPITFDQTQVFGLINNEAKPGLYLSRSEFDEMCANSAARSIADVIWDLCGCHAGIASAMLFHFQSHFKERKSVDPALLVRLANSKSLYTWISGMRGVATPLRLIEICHKLGISDEDCKRCFEILDTIAGTFGDFDGHFPKSHGLKDIRVLNLLVEHGFLFENSVNYSDIAYRFASCMHQKVWMFNRYTNSTKIWNDGIAEFLIDVVCRMRGKKLLQFANENKGILRENQIQQEFYYAISTAVPANVNVVPEWETMDEYGCVTGYVDYNVMVDDRLWFYEFLVNGDRHGAHLKRFEKGGKYFDCLGKDNDFVIVDFRYGKPVRISQKKTIYVELSDDFKSCTFHGYGVEKKRTVLFVDSRIEHL